MVDFKIWGEEGIDQASIEQMEEACNLPVAVAGALMPDSHLGYGLPIGGVLALKGAVCPYAVGVDIACRMKLSVVKWPNENLNRDVISDTFAEILEEATFFGIGCENTFGYNHPVLHKPRWRRSPVLNGLQEKAAKQLGTSGTGNHFVEFGIFRLYEPHFFIELQVSKPYLGILSHSGSRGVGAAVCNYYSTIAKDLRPQYGNLAYLDLDSEHGRDYWEDMNLMGEYAKANHEMIHSKIASLLGVSRFSFQTENHHNFAWKERFNGLGDVIVHRKGATPAGLDLPGIIPGSMGTPTYLARGLGNNQSLNSSSHGAGRIMSRTEAKRTFNYETEIVKLSKRGIRVLSAGADEVVGVYKDIDKVMDAQRDLCRVIGRFDPRLIKMAPGNERAED